MTLEADILARITPGDDDRKAMQQDTEALLGELDKALERLDLPGRASIQGSVAKDTWLRGSTDLDCFLLLDPGVEEDVLKRAAQLAGGAILTDVRQKYAQHPYAIGTWRGRQVDLVPAYAVAQATDHMSAVDRTPFHTQWVREHLDDQGRQQARLLKQWCKGVEVYGAETAIGGFSGYLVEVLVARHGGFSPVLQWLADVQPPVRLDGPDDDAPLQMADPIDAGRNLAAAVRADVLERAKEAARAYLAAPAERFFFPEPPRAEPADVLRAALKQRHAAWLGLWLTPKTDRLDIVLPQFQRAAGIAARGLQDAGFAVHGALVTEHDGHVGMQWLTDAAGLPETQTRTGPPADADDHAQRFRGRWEQDPLRIGDIEVVDGRLQVEVKVPQRTPATYLEAHKQRLLSPKHVQRALPGTSASSAPEDAHPTWAPAVADFVLDRRPWQR